MNLAGVDINAYTSAFSVNNKHKDGALELPYGAGNTHKISAWHSKTSVVRPNSANKDALHLDASALSQIIRSDRTGSKEKALTAKLLRTELARDQAEAKLREWKNVARELQEVIQQQQQQMDTLFRRKPARDRGDLGQPSHLHNRPPSSHNTSSGGPGSHVAQLQDLVKLVRTELESNNCTSDRSTPQLPPLADKSSPGEAVRLQTEIAALRRQLTTAQLSQRSVVEQQREEIAALAEQLKASQADHDRVRAALQDAEMEIQSALTERARLRGELEAADAARCEGAKEISVLQEELGRTKAALETEKACVAAANGGRDEALALANEATTEMEKLHKALESSKRSEEAMKIAAQQAGAEISATEARVKSLEATLAVEKSKRSGFEALVGDLQGQLLGVQGEANQVARRAQVSAAESRRREEALHQELERAHEERLTARKQADALQRQVDSLRGAQSNAKAEIDALHNTLTDVQTERNEAVRRAEQMASELQAKTTSLAAEAEAKLQRETGALKEVLCRVSASAQQRDVELGTAQKRLQEAMHAVADLTRQLEEHQIAANAEFKKYEAQLALEREKHEGPPVELQIMVQEPSDQIVRAAVLEERRGHVEAVAALEEAHRCRLEAIQAEHEAEIRELNSMVVELRQQNASAEKEEESTARLRAAESELLSAQSQAAHLNSVIDKLRKKDKQRKEELVAAKAANEEGQEELMHAMQRIEDLEQRLEHAKSVAATAQADLVDAQDEVEALLTARLRDLSRAPSEVDDADYERVQEACTGADDGYNAMHGAQDDVGAAPYPREDAYDSPGLDRGEGRYSQIARGTDANQKDYDDRLRQTAEPRQRSQVTAASAERMPPPPPRQSPLKKLASMLRGRRDKNGGYVAEITSAGRREQVDYADRPGPVGRTLERSDDGSVRFKPTANSDSSSDAEYEEENDDCHTNRKMYYVD
jgi:chromosome segregation ATPase